VGQKGPDFILALGPNETIVGGPGDDQLGAIGVNATIKGGAGDDQLFGGEGSTLTGGPGHDFFYDPKDNGTVRVMSSGNEVVVTGNNDHVSCASTSSNVVIYANSTDPIDPTCMADHAQVLPAGNASVAARLASYEQSSQGGQQGVSGGFTGRGTNDDPYVSICTPGGAVFCKADQFESRSLKGIWSNEYVPAYKCPADYPYLYNRKYVPEEWIVPPGVGIAASGMGFNISGRMWKKVGDKDLQVGIKTGALNSSVTNWEDKLNYYQIKLYCTSDPNQAVTAKGGVL
jgi:hypothetical protein